MARNSNSERTGGRAVRRRPPSRRPSASSIMPAGLYRQKLYDLAIPEFEKYLDQYPNAAGCAGAYFFLAESYRALSKSGAARKNFQAVLDKFGDSDYAGPAAYVLAETAFTEKNYGAALPLFHRACIKIEGAGDRPFRALFRGALSGDARQKRRCSRHLSSGHRCKKSQSLSGRLSYRCGLDFFIAWKEARGLETI